MKTLILMASLLISTMASAQLKEPGLLMFDHWWTKMTKENVAADVSNNNTLATTVETMRLAARDPEIKKLSATLSQLLGSEVYLACTETVPGYFFVGSSDKSDIKYLSDISGASKNLKTVAAAKKAIEQLIAENPDNSKVEIKPTTIKATEASKDFSLTNGALTNDI